LENPCSSLILIPENLPKTEDEGEKEDEEEAFDRIFKTRF
jgi:hypothetical protein